MVTSIIRNRNYYTGKNLKDHLFVSDHFVVKNPEIQERFRAKPKGQAFGLLTLLANVGQKKQVHPERSKNDSM